MDICTKCPRRPVCTEPCRELEALLPSADAGRDWNLEAADAKARAAKTVANMLAVRAMLDWRHVLSGRQREAFDLYFNDGLSQEEIALRMGLQRVTVDRLLQRARRRMRAAVASEARQQEEQQRAEEERGEVGELVWRLRRQRRGRRRGRRGGKRL